MQGLNQVSLESLSGEVEVPRYNRARTGTGIVHLGLGAFHRAHQALYTEAAMNRSGGDWGIVGVSMRSATVAQQLAPQDCLYSLLAESGETRSLQVIGALQGVIVAPAEPRALDAILADPTIHIVTLTITEKGYCLDGSGWQLDREHPDIQHDLDSPEDARSAIGLLARGLEKRRQQGGAALTVISCDNLSENSARLRSALLAYADTAYPQLAGWLASAVTFPSSMVDRIVPAMTDAGRDAQAALLGLRDEAAVATEPFSQWIIEDNFASDRPDWENVGVQLVADIRPYEALKLRLLNASHSAIAYLGLLAEKETVADVMADPVLGTFVRRLMNEELIPALEVPAGFDVAEYRDQLLARFANPRLHHRCAQIAMDGTEKIPQRWLATLEGQQSDSALLCQALAVWSYLVLLTSHPLQDPRLAQLMQLRDDSSPLTLRLDALLACIGITAERFASFPSLRTALLRNVEVIADRGLAGLLQG